jgi:hypothetical protein
MGWHPMCIYIYIFSIPIAANNVVSMGQKQHSATFLWISIDVWYHIIQKYAAFAQVTFLCNVQQYHGSHMNIYFDVNFDGHK